MISLEGNVGVGKSTVLRELERRGLHVHFEAVDHWTLLEPFYRDPARFGFAFQLQVLTSYAATPAHTQIVERSSDAALEVFVPLAEQNGNLQQHEAHELRRMANMLPLPQIQRFVFLVADPELCLRRIAWRHREGEERITLAYLQQLDQAYARFMAGIPDNRKLMIPIQEQDSPASIADRIVHAMGI
jgi:deoxyadenosine/deoxycytidine kinase